MSECKNCEICAAYNNYLALRRKGLDEKESFHEAVAYLAGEVIEDLLEVGFEDGYETGYISALNNISKQTSDLSDELETMWKKSCESEPEDVAEVYNVDMECGINCPCDTPSDCILDAHASENVRDGHLTDDDFIRWMKDRW